MVALDMSASMNAVDLTGAALEEKLANNETPLVALRCRGLAEEFVSSVMRTD